MRDRDFVEPSAEHAINRCLHSSVSNFRTIQYTILDGLDKITLLCQFERKAELNELKLLIVICLRKSEVTVERISVCNVIEKLMKHGVHCLPCPYTNDVINMLPVEAQL